jgi:hypothetical protein
VTPDEAWNANLEAMVTALRDRLDDVLAVADDLAVPARVGAVAAVHQVLGIASA